MFCAISGESVDEPVVSVKSGHIFEKRMIEKSLHANQGRCPITDQPLELSDLIPLKINKVVKPRPTTATSIPAMLSLFQSEWDALMLETYSLKQQLDTVRQELANSLYQHDAACRVIARLLKERDDARSALLNYRPENPTKKAKSSSGEDMQVEASVTLPKEVKDQIQAKSSELSQGRKNRVISSTLATPEEISAFQPVSSYNYHKSGINSVDIHPTKPEIIVTGGADSAAILFNTNSKKVVSTLEDHKGPVRKVSFHPSNANVLLTSGEDGFVKAWKSKKEDLSSWGVYYNMQLQGPIVGFGVHPTGDQAIIASAYRSFAIHDISQGKNLGTVNLTYDPSSLEIHPDGLIFGVGTSDSNVKIWDIKMMKNVATVEGHKSTVTSVSFSENGYFMATSSLDNTVKFWDLRKLKSFQSFDVSTPTLVQFDISGNYLGVAASEIQIFNGQKTFSQLTKFTAHTANVTSFKWGQDAKSFVTTSLDKTVKLWKKT